MGLRKKIFWPLFLVISACSGDMTDTGTFLEARQSIAAELEKDGSYADALTQWKILKAAYPEDENIDGEISRIESLIKLKIDKLLASLSKAKKQRKKDQIGTLYLKILALEPANVRARKALRQIEWDVAYEATSLKTATIKKYFKESQIKAQRSIRTTRFMTQAQRMQKEGRQQALVKLADRFLKEYPKNNAALKYRYDALVQRGEEKVASHEFEEAVVFFQQALLKGDVGNKKLASRITALKEKLSRDYYRLGMKNFKIDIDIAVKMLQTSMSYNPGNLKAGQQLIRAIRVQKNLQKIKENAGR